MLYCFLPAEGQRYVKSADLAIRLLENEDGDVYSCNAIVRLGCEDGKVNIYTLGSLKDGLIREAYRCDAKGIRHGERSITYAWVDTLALRPALTSRYDFVVDHEENLQATMILVGGNHSIKLNRRSLRDGEGSCEGFTAVRMMLGDVAQVGNSWFHFGSGLSQSKTPPGFRVKMRDLSEKFTNNRISSSSVSIF
jgi:hypothetical protein